LLSDLLRTAISHKQLRDEKDVKLVVEEHEEPLVINIQKQLKCKVIKVVGRGGQGLVLLVELEAPPNNRAVVKVATK